MVGERDAEGRQIQSYDRPPLVNWASKGRLRSVVPNVFRAISPLDVPPPAHSLRAQGVPVGRCEALNDKIF